MTLEVGIQITGVILTFLGLSLIWYQIRSARQDSMTSSFISAVADHWMLIEDRRMQIRSGEMKVSYRLLPPHLEKLLSTEYQGNLATLAKDFLYHAEGDQLIGLVTQGKDNVFEEIIKEYAYEDLIFNLYEEEFTTGKYLHLVNKKLWDYWESYMKQGFQSSVRQNHWRLRQVVGKTFPEFAKFVEQQCLGNTPHKINHA